MLKRLEDSPLTKLNVVILLLFKNFFFYLQPVEHTSCEYVSSRAFLSSRTLFTMVPLLD